MWLSGLRRCAQARIVLGLLGIVSWSAASPQSSTTTPTPDQLEIYKSLPKDQQDAILQGVTGGKNDGTGKKNEPKVEMPTTIEQKKDNKVEYDAFGKPIREKTK